MLQTRKNVLDKARTELADSVNKSNQIYTLEELSTIVQEQSKLISDQKKEMTDMQTKYDSKVASLESVLNSVKAMAVRNDHDATPSYGSNLNIITEKNAALMYFSPDTIGRPPCTYGIVQNLSVGSSSNPGGSYWTFQIANCTTDNRLYVRKRINTASPDAWSNWGQQ